MMEKFNPIQKHLIKGVMIGVLGLVMNFIALMVVGNFFVWFITLIMAAFFSGIAVISAIFVYAFRYHENEEYIPENDQDEFVGSNKI